MDVPSVHYVYNIFLQLAFAGKIQQAEGRVVPDLTVTEVSLFHIRELRTGEFNHRPCNLGWGITTVMSSLKTLVSMQL